ncbi:UNVERIFIED_CONTAM: hypothetical protein RMT77_009606 [Armadillidium vulgare]
MKGVLPSGHTYEVVREEESENLKKYQLLSDGAIRIQPGNLICPTTLLKFVDLIYNFEVKQTDIFINTFPKSGTNWIAEIVWNLIYNPDLENPDASKSLDYRYPFFDIDYGFAISTAPKFNPEGDLVKKFKKLCPGKDYNEGLHIHTAAALPDPRLLKGHLLLPFWPPNILDKAKVIYLARDPRDVVVSFYHFSKFSKTKKTTATLDEFVDDFMDNIVISAYWEHVRLGWEKRNNPNFLFLFYEDLKENPNEQIKKIDQFIGTNRSHNQIENVANYTSFNSMKKKSKDNPPASFDKIYYDDSKKDKENNFFRKGKVGSWKEDLPLHLQEKMNNWMKINLSQFTEDFKYKKEQFS